MDPRDNVSAPAIALGEPPVAARARRIAGHVLALLLAAAVTWLIFAAYRQPDFILEFAGRLC